MEKDGLKFGSYLKKLELGRRQKKWKHKLCHLCCSTSGRYTPSTPIERRDSGERKGISIQSIAKEMSTDCGISIAETGVTLVMWWEKAPGLKPPVVLQQKMV